MRFTKLASAFIALILVATTPLASQAIGFKKPALPGGGPSKLEPIVTQIKGAQMALTMGSIALSDARISMMAAKGNKQRASELKAELDQANAITDPQEKDAAVKVVEAKIKEDGAAAVEGVEAEQQEVDAAAGEALGNSLVALVGAIGADVVAAKTLKDVAQNAPGTVDEVKSGGAGALVSEGGNLKYVLSALTSDVPSMATQLPAQAIDMVGFLKQAREYMTAKGMKVPDSVAAQEDVSFGS